MNHQACVVVFLCVSHTAALTLTRKEWKIDSLLSIFLYRMSEKLPDLTAQPFFTTPIKACLSVAYPSATKQRDIPDINETELNSLNSTDIFHDGLKRFLQLI